MKNSIIKLCLFSILSLSFSVYAQVANPPVSLILSPAKGYSKSNQLVTKIFFDAQAQVILNWSKDLSGKGAKLKIGKSPGNYNLKTIDVSSNNLTFVPNNRQLSVGRYYAVITNSTKTNLSEISKDFSSNPGTIELSNEIQFVVEAKVAPNTISPKGEITKSVPTFEWSPVAGVPGYWLILSSSPFEVVTLDNGQISVRGADIIWNYVTDKTSVQYGQISTYSPYKSEAPPLLPNNEYNFTILNLYDLNDISFVSSVFAGVTSFKYKTEVKIAAPKLISPVNNKVFYADENITFKWDPVNGANGYTLYLLNRVKTFAGNEQQIDLPVWNSFTSNTSIIYPARTALTKGEYIWYVIPKDNQGAGNISAKNTFKYEIDISDFIIRGYNTTNNSDLLSFEVRARSISGGVSPANPFLLSNSTSYSDSLVSGVYEFSAKKDGFNDSTFVYTLSPNKQTNVNIYLRPIPSMVSAQVVNRLGNPVADATVILTNLTTNNKISVQTGLDGKFSKFTPRGTYKIQASKPGYLASETRTITVANTQLILDALKIVKDNVTLSGKVNNDESKPVNLATVKATNGNVVQETNTDESGNFSFNLSSGQWKLEINKTGFVAPEPVIYNLVAGDNLQNQNFQIIPKANQVSGFVYKVTVVNGQTGYLPFDGIEVTASPQSGQAVKTVTNTSGQFNLSLRSGSYTISSSKTGYTLGKSIILSVNIGETVSGLSLNLTENPSKVTGSVTDHNGAPIEGAVILTATGLKAETLPNGVYSISVPAGNKIFAGSKNGYIAPQPISFSIAPGQSINDINFQMTANAGTIAGKVTSLQYVLTDAEVYASDGTKIIKTFSDELGQYTLNVKPGTWKVWSEKVGFLKSDEISVTVNAGQKSANNNFKMVQNTAVVQGSVFSNNVPFANILLSITEKTSVVEYTLTTVNGNYSASLEAGKEYIIYIKTKGFYEYTRSTGVLVAGSTNTFNIDLEPVPASISGFVFNTSNVPLDNAVLKIKNLLDGNYIKDVSTNPDGSYSFGIPAGSYNIICSLEGYLEDSTQVVLERGQEIKNVNFSLIENFAIISGTVKDNNEQPLETVLINLIGDNNWLTATSDAQGNFFVPNVLGDNYQVTATKEGYLDAKFENLLITDGQVKEISLILEVPLGKITGIVLDINGLPVDEATVIATDPQGNQYRAVTNSEGFYEISSLPFGDYLITIIKSGFAEIEPAAIVLTQVEYEKPLDVNDLVPADSKITGRVVDASGNLLSEVEITIGGEHGSGQAVTNNSGEFEITNLLPGNYVLNASRAGYAVVDTLIDLVNDFDLRLQLVKNTSSINGTVKNQLGNNIVFSVPVKAISGKGIVYNTQTDANGNFQFVNLANNESYVVLTDIFREGYVNDSTAFNLPKGVEVFNDANLVVNVHRTRISGNVGIDGAQLALLYTKTNSIKTLESSTDGKYEFNFLKDGTYSITPTLQGYQFTPATKQVTVGAKDTIDVSFTSSKNSGRILVNVKGTDGKGIEGADVTAISTGGAFLPNQFTGNGGQAIFNNVPAGSYDVRVTKEGYKSNPSSAPANVTSGNDANVNFTLTNNNSKVSGIVNIKENGNSRPGPDAQVQLTYSTGQSYYATSDAAGKYSFENLAAGEISLKASLSGATSTIVNYSLKAEENKTDLNLDIIASVVQISGRVVYEGIGVPNLSIEAVSNTSTIVSTNLNGDYIFNNMPVKKGANDTTIYQIKIKDENYSSKKATLKIASSMIGTSVKVPDFILPSGQVSAQVTDGIMPLEGVKLNFSEPNGKTTSIYTEESGLFESDRKLAAGSYKISLSKELFLSPDLGAAPIVLKDDTSKVRITYQMPFRMQTIDSVYSDRQTEVIILSNIALTDVAGKLYYKTQSAATYTSVQLTKNETKLIANIPALYSTENVLYYTEVTRQNNTKYVSSVANVASYASGLLNSLKILPEMSNLILRKDDSYNVEIDIRDGINKNINHIFVGSGATGTIQWEVLSEVKADVSFPQADDPTKALITTGNTGQVKINITSSYLGRTVIKDLTFQVSDVPLKGITVKLPDTRMSNKEDGIQLNYNAVDTLDRIIILGNSIEWMISPETAGSISNSGFFIPVDSSYIGNTEITLFDDLTGLSGSSELSVYAEIDGRSSYSLTNKKGLALDIPAGAVQAPIEVSIGKGQFGPAKKHFSPSDDQNTYTVADEVYKIIYSGSSLPGDSLFLPATFQIPVSESLNFFGGDQSIGLYDPIAKVWVKIPGSSSQNKSGWIQIPASSDLGQSLKTDEFYKFGEYSILSENEPLGFKHLSVLPSPFSPNVAPLKVGYFLTTSAPPASVTIKIYNVRGELVRTLLEDDIQFPGKYGSRNSQKEILWDGLTDDNYMARNGRYILQVKAKDQKDDVSKLIQVILIK